jgi:hypothetical protein
MPQHRNKPRVNLTLAPQTRAQIDAIAEARGGLSTTRVVELAVDRLARAVLGRHADLKPIRSRKPVR